MSIATRTLKLSLAISIALTSQTGGNRAYAAAPTATSLQSIASSDEIQNILKTLNNAEQREAFSNVFEFLSKIGFENYLPRIEASLKNPNLNSEQRFSLQDVKERAETVNSSKILAALIMSKASSQITSEEYKTRFENFLAHAVSYGILGLPEEPPAEIANMATTASNMNIKSLAIDKFLNDYIEKAANKSGNNMRADIMSVLYSESEILHLSAIKDPQYLAEKELLTKHVSIIAKNYYLHLESLQSNFLADMLIKSIAGQSYRTNDPSLLKWLSNILLDRTGEPITNYISSDYFVIDQKSKKVMEALDFKNGDIIQSYSPSAETYLQNVSYSPKTWTEKIINFFQLKLGLSLERKLYPMAQIIENKKAAGQKLTIREHLVSYITNLPVFRRGFNTQGLVKVVNYSEPSWNGKSISNVLVFDPRETVMASGVVLQTVRGFTGPIAARLARLRFKSDRLVTATNKDLILSQTPKTLETLKTSKQSEWLENKVAPAAISKLESMMVGEDLVMISWANSPNKYKITGMTALEKAFREGPGVRITTVETIANRSLSNPGEGGSIQKAPSSGPNTLYWSDTMNTKVVSYTNQSIEAARLNTFTSDAPVVDVKVYNAVNEGPSIVEFKAGELGQVVNFAKVTPEAQALSKPSVFAEKKARWNNITHIDSKTAATASDGVMNNKEMLNFLRVMGWEDYSVKIRKQVSREQNKNIAQINRNQQDYSLRAYDTRNMSVEIAVVAMGKMQGRMNSEAGQQQIAQLAAYLTNQQSIKPLTTFPKEVVAESNPEEREKKLIEATRKATLVTMQDHSKAMMSELLAYMYGTEIAKKYQDKSLDASTTKEVSQMIKFLEARIVRIVEAMYLDVNNGPCRELGTAFTILAARQAEKRSIEKVWRKNAINAFERYGMYYESIVDGAIVSRNAQGTKTHIPLKTFDAVLTKTKESMNSAGIPWAVKVNKSLQERTSKFGLQGTITGLATVITPESLGDGLTWLEKMRDKTFDKTPGFSHYGEARVFEVPYSKIRVARLRHNYPHYTPDEEKFIEGAKHIPGGWTEVDLFSFLSSSHHAKVAVAHKNPEKMFEMFKAKAAETGIPQVGSEIGFGADLFKFDEDPVTGTPLYLKKQMPKESLRVGILNNEVVVTQTEINELYTATNVTDWLRIRSKLMDRMSDLFLTHGMMFHWITPEGLHHPLASYCSLNWEMAEMIGLGQGTEYAKADWHPFVKAGRAIYEWGKKNNKKYIIESGLKDLSILAGMPIVAPNSKAAQAFVDKVSTIQLPWQDPRDRVKNDWGVYSSISKDWNQIVKQEGGPEVEKFFQQLKIEPYDMYAIAGKLEHNLHVRAGMADALLTTVQEIIKHEDKSTLTKLLATINGETEQEKSPVKHKTEAKIFEKLKPSGSPLRCEGLFL